MHLFRSVLRAMRDHWALVYFFSIVSSVKCDKTDMKTGLNVSFILSKVIVGWIWFPSIVSSGVVELFKNSSPTPTELVGSVVQGQFGIGIAKIDKFIFFLDHLGTCKHETICDRRPNWLQNLGDVRRLYQHYAELCKPHCKALLSEIFQRYNWKRTRKSEHDSFAWFVYNTWRLPQFTPQFWTRRLNFYI